MTSLPQLPRAPISTQRREYLALWLAHWRMARAMDPPGAPADPFIAPRTANPEPAEPLQAGSVRLLSTHLSPDAPRYVALLQPAGDDAWHIIPFSRYPAPATDGELATHLEWTPLKVLCAWNRRRLPHGELTRCREVHTLPPELIAELESLVRAQCGPHTAPAALLARCGVPLWRPLDPRHDYMDDERACFECVEQRAADKSPGPNTVYPFPTQDEFKKAAEDGEDYEV